jgi:hypothetical protein
MYLKNEKTDNLTPAEEYRRWDKAITKMFEKNREKANRLDNRDRFNLATSLRDMCSERLKLDK